jgi:membrane protease YdiL (CAAX protease family)
LLGRLFLVESEQELLTPFNFGRFFLYFLLFEAFAVQLWAFGLLFRGLADWRGPLTAAITGGVLFGAVSSQFFDEAFLDTITSLLYFTVWGIFYGLIRLRTSSLLGTTLVQAFQSLTTWHILLPEAQPDVAQLHNLYLLASTLYLLFIWRLWPHEEDDYRV